MNNLPGITQLPNQDPAEVDAERAGSDDPLLQVGLEGLPEATGAKRPLVTWE